MDNSKPAMVYRNLREGRKQGVPVYSVMRNGRVVAHTRAITLRNAEFIVRESGRQKVLRERRKNVHAFVRGQVVEPRGWYPWRVVYNPYKGPNFYVDSPSAPAVVGADEVTIDHRGIFTTGLVYKGLTDAATQQ